MVDARDINGLIRLLDHADFDVQWRAANALGTMGAGATGPLLNALEHRSTDVRLGAIEALAAIRDLHSIDHFVIILESDENNEIRWAAALALGEIGNRSVIPFLVRALKDEDRYVRFGAAKALEQVDWQPENDQERAYHLLAIQDWIGVKKIGRVAIGPLIELLKEEHPAMRAKMVEILGDIGGILAQKACEHVLQDPEGDVRWGAVLASKKCGVAITRLPWGLSKRPRTGPNAAAAALLNFLFLGLGYNYIGKWWGFLVFMSYMSLIVLAQLQLGPFMPYIIAYPITALFATQTYVMAKHASDM